MSPGAFRRWLAEMHASGAARSDAECGRLLGVTTETVRVWKLKGSSHATALACAALLKGLTPYSETDE